MTPAASNTREKLLMAAMELFTTRGYEATSIADILERAGVNSGSLYYFFDSKQDLLLAGLDLFKTLLYPIVMQPAFERESDPIERIFAVLADYRQRLVLCNLDYECPMGKLALEVGRRLEPAREKIAVNFAGWRDHIRQCLDQAADRLPASLDRATLATFVLTVMEGALMQARTHRDLSFYDHSVQHLRAYFNQLVAEGHAEALARARKTAQRH
jgi:AcrR family transcriptional regulator